MRALFPSQPKVGGVYLIRNIVTGDSYVGSSKHIARRWQQHRFRLRRGLHWIPALQAAWDAQAPETFRIELLEVVADATQLFEREDYHMSAVHPTYNVFRNALGFGRTYSSATLEKMRCSHLGKTLPLEQRMKQSRTLTGRKLSPEHVAKVARKLTGRTVSADTRARQSEAQRRRFARSDERARNAEHLARARDMRWREREATAC